MTRAQLGKTYEPGQVESKWYTTWEAAGCFKPVRDSAETYTIVIPPPNVTGILHMGHVLNNTIQDIFVRRARMQGKATLWLPGTDHASIATEAKVVRALRDEGTDKGSIGRERFVERAWDWSNKYGGTIIEQLKRLGCTCDWDRLAFTMDDDYYQAVIETFVRLHAAGHIYRGERLINWDPQGRTALSDEEVIHRTTNGRLWYFRYPLKSGAGHIVVATTRPETMLGDTGIAVNPKDERYTDFIGETALLPLVGRELPIFADEFVDPEFGTGAVKVTPAHDPNDYELGQRHDLEQVNIFHPDATLNDNVPQKYRGLDRFAARKAVVADLEAMGVLEKIEDHEHNVGYSERTDAMVEPYLSRQWFCRMDDLARPAQAAVASGRIKLYPERWVKVYDHWLSNIRDWCISRQLWWGHRIPAWYGDDGHVFVARTGVEALDQARKHYGRDDVQLEQDSDVLDTWFSSWLWPFATLGWPQEDSADLTRFYPTQTLVTAPDIIFFWVARMIMAGFQFRGEIPFDTVYFTGTVRDMQGRKMSKSLGNSPDPIDIIDTYGADALRMGLMLIAPQGQDILFSEDDITLGRNYMNKIWNAARFVIMNLDDELPPRLDDLPAEHLEAADRWILSRLNRTIEDVERYYGRYRMNDVAKAIYDFVWSDFCDWYLEFIKHRLFKGATDSRRTAQGVAVHVLRKILGLIHPFAPFMSEELWQNFQRAGDGLLIQSAVPAVDAQWIDATSEADIGLIQSIISGIRSARSELGIDPAREAHLVIQGPGVRTAIVARELQLLHGLTRFGKMETGTAAAKPAHAATIVVGDLTVFIDLEGLLDFAAERQRLGKRIADMQGRLGAVSAKLSNVNFVDRAPAEVVAREREKQADYQAQLQKLQDNLQALD